jgi:copper(I)-binding protein
MRLRIIVPILSLALGLAACAPATPTEAPVPGGSASVGGLRIAGAWARAASLMSGAATSMPMGTPEGGMGMEMAGTNSAAYMIIRNDGGQADRLIRAESDVATAVELHNVKMENDVMTMFQVDGIDVPANGQAELKPGSFHVMLIGLTRDLKPGDQVKLTLTFEKAGPVTLEAEVREP